MKPLHKKICLYMSMDVVFIVVLLVNLCLVLCTTGYPIDSYEFKVYPVDACPTNFSTFRSAAEKMNCSNGTRYLCSPDRNLGSLIEFCTDRPRKLYGKGFCIRLEGTGDLNHYSCEERFFQGCPDTPYFDNETYKFPECLKIDKENNCFTADLNCSNIQRYPNSPHKEDANVKIQGIEAVYVVICLIIFVAFLLLLRRFRKAKKEKENHICIDELRQFLSKKYIQVYHARFIIVGCAQAGKTTLLKRLQDKPYREVINVQETHGVDVHINSFEMLEDTIRDVKTKEAPEMNIIISEEDILREKENRNVSSDCENDNQKQMSVEIDELKPLLTEKPIKTEDYSSNENEGTEEKIAIPIQSNVSVEGEIITTAEDPVPIDGMNEETTNLENYAMLKIFDAVQQIGKEKRNPRITFLDFAGQNAYYAFHQIYLSPKTFFILVIDMSKKFTDKNENDVRGGSRFLSWTYKDYYKFWLKSIDSFSDVDTPVIVVATHAENKSEQDCQQFFEEFFDLFDERGELRRHLHANRTFAIRLPESGSKLEDVDEIKKCISSLVKESKYWKSNMRSAWAIFEHIVEREKSQRKIISRDRVLEYNRSLQPGFRMSEEEITEMLLFLHRVGALLYLDEENVRNTIILDVQWFVNAFKYIITDSVSMHEPTDKDRKRFYDTGELSDKELEHIWKKHYKDSKDFLDHKKEILSFMEQLCLLAVCSSDGSTMSEGETWYYFPCMNKRKFGSDSLTNHSRSSILCFQFDEQGQLPIFLFYGLVLKCLKLPGWTFLTEKKGQRCIYEDVACYHFHKHIVVLCLCKFQIQVQVCVPTQSADPSTTVLKEVQESIEKKIQDFKKYSYKVGYKCQNGTLFDEKDNSFIEQDLFPLEKFLCDKCSVGKKHYVDNDICWVKMRKSGKLENRQYFRDHKEETDEGSASLRKILDACLDGNTNNFEFYLQNEIRDRKHLLKKTYTDGWNILHFAAKGGNCKIFQKLISENLDVLQKTNEQMTVLHIVAQNGHYDICKDIVDNARFSAILNDKSIQGKNACHYAAESGSIDVLKLLASKNIDVKEATKDGQNMFHIACIHDKLEMCQFIAEKYHDMIFAENDDKWNATLFAAKQGHMDILHFLHEQNVSFEHKSESCRTALHIACDNGHLSACIFITKVCPSLLPVVDYKGRHAGHFAARNGNVDIMKYLVSKNADVTKNTHTEMNILHMACLHSRKEMCRYLLQTFPGLKLQRTTRGWTTLHFVAGEGINEGDEIEIFEMITGTKDMLEINALTNKKNSVLTLAIKHNFYDFCEYLLRKHSYLLDIPNAISPSDIGIEDTKMTKLLEQYVKL